MPDEVEPTYIEEHICPYCQKPVQVSIDTKSGGIIPSTTYDLIADWIYHSACWDEFTTKFPPDEGL